MWRRWERQEVARERLAASSVPMLAPAPSASDSPKVGEGRDGGSQRGVTFGGSSSGDDAGAALDRAEEAAGPAAAAEVEAGRGQGGARSEAAGGGGGSMDGSSVKRAVGQVATRLRRLWRFRPTGLSRGRWTGWVAEAAICLAQAFWPDIGACSACSASCIGCPYRCCSRCCRCCYCCWAAVLPLSVVPRQCSVGLPPN